MHPGSEATTSNRFALSCWTTRVQRRLGRQRATELPAFESTRPLRLRAWLQSLNESIRQARLSLVANPRATGLRARLSRLHPGRAHQERKRAPTFHAL